MSRFLLSLLIPFYLFGFSWDYTHEFSLKKDEVGVVRVTNRYDESVRDILIHWTLYVDKRLVLLIKYDSFPTQYIIKKEYKRNSIKIDLRDDYKNPFTRSYLLLTFKDFRDEKAILNVNVSDPKKRVRIDYYDPKK
jgi:hypothetical protein